MELHVNDVLQPVGEMIYSMAELLVPIAGKKLFVWGTSNPRLATRRCISMSRGTLSPEHSSHRRIISADECCVVRSRISRGDKSGSEGLAPRLCRSTAASTPVVDSLQVEYILIFTVS